jgi:hypothetical protein
MSRRWARSFLVGVAVSAGAITPAAAVAPAAASVRAASVEAQATTTAPPTFTSSTITSPAPGAELFYDADTGSGSVAVSGSVSPAVSSSGDLLCYSAPGLAPTPVEVGIPVIGGNFSVDTSLAPIKGSACRLRFVNHNTEPSSSSSTIDDFSGPQISVSEQQTHSVGSVTYGYYVLSGTLPWSFAFGSLGECPVLDSYSTDTDTLGSYLLFAGNACLLGVSGIAPDQGTRSAIQVDGLNAYPPAAISDLTGQPGYMPLSYTATFDALHDTVTITESEDLMVCQPPGGYPPTTSTCPGFNQSGIQYTQTTTLLPGGEVARVQQTFTNADTVAHTLDLLVSQSVAAPCKPASGQTGCGLTPAFEFPGQPEFASHEAPDSFTLFPTGPGTIYVIANAVDAPAVSNPLGAITYQTPPTSADFVSPSGAQTATLLMHYQDQIPAGGTYTLNWSFAQASSAADLTPLVQIEQDRYFNPTLTVSAPVNGTTQSSPVVVRGSASDEVGVSSVSVNGASATLSDTGSFSVPVKLRSGENTITVVATNVAGNTATITRSVRYTPIPCTVPKLHGQTLKAARKLLASHDCTAGKVARAYSAAVKSGRVLTTSPRAGARRAHGTRVRLTVSLGPRRAAR